MEAPIRINLVYEDDLSLAVMQKILAALPGKFEVGTTFPAHGCGKIRKQIRAYNLASKYSPYWILTDLDDAPCPCAMIQDWFADTPISGSILFRIAVREIEAWVMADRTNFAKFLQVSESKMPREPEKEPDPKQTLLNLAKNSKSSVIRKGLVPRNPKNATIGPDYNFLLMKFVFETWNLYEAMENAPSLNRTFHRLSTFSTESRHE